MGVFTTLAAIIEAEGAGALVTVVAARGSTPREAGARMVVSPAGEVRGTIGGGNFEWLAMGQARAALERAQDGFAMKRFALGPDLGQCCGGDATVLIEIFTATRTGEVAVLAARERQGPFATRAAVGAGNTVVSREILPACGPAGARLAPGEVLEETFGAVRRTIVLFGAGHVGRAVVLALAPLDFDVLWADARDGMFPAMTPGNVRCVHAGDPAGVLALAPDGAFILIMTHSHPGDLDVLRLALLQRRFSHIGLIGSLTKRARFISRLKASGVDPSLAQAFKCPIGIEGVESKEPARIALAVAAELVILDERARAPASLRAAG